MTINELPLVMVRCLLLTIFIETSVALLLKVRDKKDILNVVLVQMITNPLVVSIPFVVILIFGYKYYQITIYILEIINVFVEGFIYYKLLNYKKINPFVLALILNVVSYLIGEVLNRFVL